MSRFRLYPFRSPLLGVSRAWFLFLEVLRCFNSLRVLPNPTSLRLGLFDFTQTGFPHSDTHGSTLFWQLTVLFRGLNRPSSPACPKASTSCPESLIIISFLDLRVRTNQPKLISSYSSPIRRSPRNFFLVETQFSSRSIPLESCSRFRYFWFVFLIFFYRYHFSDEY